MQLLSRYDCREMTEQGWAVARCRAGVGEDGGVAKCRAKVDEYWSSERDDRARMGELLGVERVWECRERW